jgi:type IV pilus assembly protein PilQ
VKLRCGLVLALLAAGASLAPLSAAQRATESQTESAPAATSNSTGGVALSLRRSPDGVQLVIEGTGAGPVLQQSRNGDAWRGDLRITTPDALRLGPQRMTLPEAGLQSVSFQGSGSDYQLQIVPMPGAPLSRPVVSADGRNLILTFAAPSQPPAQTAQFNLRQPGMVPQPTYAPPLQPRAIAPPLGDMAVGSMVLRNRSYLNLNGPAVTMTLRNAPAKDAFMALAQLGGYGFVYVADDAAVNGSSGASSGESEPKTGARVTLAFKAEPYARALNSLLLASGLQGKAESGLLIVGPSVLGKSFGSQVSKVYRLNQASADSAANYLASLGAQVTKVTSITNVVSTGQPQANQVAGASQTQQTKEQTISTTETYGASVGPLKGLIGTSDSRLQTITLVGDPIIVSIAESYLRQVDIRQRQVALTVRILDVTLNNNESLSNSFAFRNGTSFVLSQNGRLSATFGSLVPGGDPPSANPGFAYPNNQLMDQFLAVIESSSTKVLASPTLILNENAEEFKEGNDYDKETIAKEQRVGRKLSNEGFVTVGDQVVISYTPNYSQTGGVVSCIPVFGTSGLQLGARVTRIDDNGFVTFTLSPQISAAVGGGTSPGCGSFQTLNYRRLDTGSVRVRDGQTLVLTGVISDADVAAVTKWPVLGDLPLVGQFFRGSGRSRRKSELVILVTPRVVSEADGGLYGYGYQSATQEIRSFVRSSSGVE